VPPGRPPRHTREEFIAAALSYADTHGLAALSLRALGGAVGVSTSAVYRYFLDKESLIVALREQLLGEMIEEIWAAPEGPRERIMAVGLAYRHAVRRHPCLSQIMNLPATEGENSAAVPEYAIGLLVELGLTGPLLARGYQQLESLIMGASSIDYADAPRHLDDRQLRLARVANPAFANSRTAASRRSRNVARLAGSQLTRATAPVPDHGRVS